jgi:Mu-like prophage protein gp16
LAKIHIAAAQLGMDEETRRILYWNTTGKNSAADMTDGERERVIAALIEKGFVDKKRANGKASFPGRPEETDKVPMMRKVEALLADSGRQWEYARATAKRMFKVERLEWLDHDQLHKLIAALQIDANRRGKA